MRTAWLRKSLNQETDDDVEIEIEKVAEQAIHERETRQTQVLVANVRQTRDGKTPDELDEDYEALDLPALDAPALPAHSDGPVTIVDSLNMPGIFFRVG
jgi:hypothetical protein